MPTLLSDTPLRGVVGDKTAKALADALELHTVADLARHYPRRYAERGELTDLARLSVGDHVTVQATIMKVNARRTRNGKQLLEAVVGDGRRNLTLTFFNQQWRQKELVVGRTGLFAGRVNEFNRTLQLAHPDYELLDDTATAADFAGALIPIYPAAAKLQSWQIAKAVRFALAQCDPPDDPLPDDLRARRRLLPLDTALRLVHEPTSRADLVRAQERLKWDEALILQATLAQRRASAARLPATPRTPTRDGIRAAFDGRLPFELTAGQREVGDVLERELAATSPMHRLLQGEVGSGKTVVAVQAMLTVVDAGGQAALLAPTEVLAQQHYRSICDLLGDLGAGGMLGGASDGTNVVLLTGSLSAGARRQALAEAASGEAGIVVGTHALLQESVEFADLGLVVVDEQHRFGVEQRDALRAKGGTAPPHVLVMTATPIPRTVAMTVYGDLETSSLRELPQGRSPIRTHVVPSGNERWVERMWERVRDEVAAGHQVYVVCPRIGDAAGSTDSDDADVAEGAPPPEEGTERRPGAAVLEVAPLLAEGPLAGLRVAILHGRLPADEKDAVMSAFGRGDVDVLVATTVIEVGVDVPNATVMVVLDADRFGVSQLHQLRGRVGRGSAAGWCFLQTDLPPGTPAGDRLVAVESTLDGFELARHDLEQRREGDVLGAAQSGARSSLRLLSLLCDEELIATAREEATRIVESDPELADHPALAAAIAQMLEPERAEFLEKA